MTASARLRAFAVGVRGFDFKVVHVRAESRARARMICARAFADAGFGTIGDGLRSITGAKLCPDAEDFQLVRDEDLADVQPEGLLWPRVHEACS